LSNQAQELRTTAASEPDRADSVQVFCADFNISPQTFYREVAARRIRMSKIAGRSVVFRSDRAEYVQLLKAEADARETKPAA
jgi:hypothetical protein